jgi:hypothetical protein
MLRRERVFERDIFRFGTGTMHFLHKINIWRTEPLGAVGG